MCAVVGFWHVALPLAGPVIALVAFFSSWATFFSFVGNWNNLIPAAGDAADRPELALTTLLAIAPILLVFLFSQRALVSGMLAGATKE